MAIAPAGGVLVAGAAAAGYLGLLYVARKRALGSFARSVTAGAASDQERMLLLGRALFAGVTRVPSDPFFVAGPLRVLGASPSTVLARGGCCAGIHRLYIASLATLGIRAAQVTVYNPGMAHAVHCLTEVRVAGVPHLIDVDYGVAYESAAGASLGLADLQRGARPVLRAFAAGLVARDASGASRPAGYPDDPYYAFDYALTKTANWTKSHWRRIAYRLLRRLTGGRIDRCRLPPALEWPEFVLAAGIAAPVLVFTVSDAAIHILRIAGG